MTQIQVHFGMCPISGALWSSTIPHVLVCVQIIVAIAIMMMQNTSTYFANQPSKQNTKQPSKQISSPDLCLIYFPPYLSHALMANWTTTGQHGDTDSSEPDARQPWTLAHIRGFSIGPAYRSLERLHPASRHGCCAIIIFHLNLQMKWSCTMNGMH